MPLDEQKSLFFPQFKPEQSETEIGNYPALKEDVHSQKM